MKKTSTILISLFILILAACLPGGIAVSPESAVTQELRQDSTILTETIRLHQSQPWGESKILLISYTSIQGHEKWSCEAVYQVEQGRIGWRISGSGAGCGNPPSTEPIVSGSGTQGEGANNLSYAYGLVRLSGASSVEITWEDGFMQRLPIINGSYLALRDGLIPSISQIEVLDVTETVIHEIENNINPQKTP